MKYYFSRVRVNKAGYTAEGYYYGAGEKGEFPVWEFSSADGEYSGTVRAWCRQAAIDKIVTAIDRRATFYR